MDWKVIGSNKISMTVTYMGESDTNTFYVEFGSGDSILTLIRTDDPDNAVKFTRAD